MQSIDSYLFVLINSKFSNGLFDWLMPFVTDLHKNKSFVMFFLPAMLALWAYKKRGQMLSILLGVAMCIGFVDVVTYRVLKPSFQRQRPPHTEKTIVLRTDRFAGFSFPSNHAANNFAGASFLSLCYPALGPLFFGIASVIAYSRVYVGVHYPFDVLAGAVMGIIFGLFFFRLWRIILVKGAKHFPPLTKLQW